MVFEQNEVINLFLSVGVCAFILANRGRIARLPAMSGLRAAFYLFLAGTVFTVVEGVQPSGTPWYICFNVLDHVAFAACSIALAVWAWRVSARREAAP